jgi:hypothetical protein
VDPRSGLDEVARKNSQPLPGLEPPIIQPIAQRYTTELSRLLIRVDVNYNFRIVEISYIKSYQNVSKDSKYMFV